MRSQLFLSLLIALNLSQDTSATLWGRKLDLHLQKRVDSKIAVPVVVPPSQYWDGVDGQWSSLGLRVGASAENVRVLISTNSPETLVVLPLGCTTDAIDPLPSDCAVSRGGLFNPNMSSSWRDQGLFGINSNGVGFEANLGYTENADYGLETLGVGFVAGDANGPTLANQTVAGFASASPFYLGMFGLGTQPVNYTDIGNFSAPSFFTSLKSQGFIPSLSWSYTAGAKYQLKAGQFAQLIFGGYDSSRFVSNKANFTLAVDIDRDIVVAIQSITYSGATQSALLSQPIFSFIESTDPNIWLPADACRAFETAFGISIDNSTGLYLINATHYAELQASNPTVTFRLANSLSGGETVNIMLPFDAFALPASYPFTPNDTYYFPLRAAANETQYTLGRAFLQEAYLTVDYERGNFSVSQCLWEDGVTPQITSILSSEGSTKQPKSIGVGIIVAIVIIAVALLAGALVVGYYFRRHQNLRRQSTATDEPAHPAPPTPALSALPTSNIAASSNIWANPAYAEMKPIIEFYKLHHPNPEIFNPATELNGSEPDAVYQLPTSDNQESDYNTVAQRIDSLRRVESTPELAATSSVFELDGGSVSSGLLGVGGDLEKPNSASPRSQDSSLFSERGVSPMGSMPSTALPLLQQPPRSLRSPRSTNSIQSSQSTNIWPEISPTNSETAWSRATSLTRGRFNGRDSVRVASPLSVTPSISGMYFGGDCGDLPSKAGGSTPTPRPEHSNIQ